ncbi:MAG: A/G-specific adenine glycosylase [Thermotaleaceae bacterium]
MIPYKIGDWENIKETILENIQKSLVDWFEKNHRKLPWRETKNPYLIWVSEVMLQQTRVDTVIPYFHKFIEVFPSLQSLAEADEEDVLRIWAGLGYYSRARNLHRGAKVVQDNYGGTIPESLKELLKIPGIGTYTAGAILSIAYGKPVPAVDGNVMRVFSRLFIVEKDISENSTKKEMEKIAERVVSHRNPSAFNQGLMELGAMICTPIEPKCTLCPLEHQCGAREHSLQSGLPFKKKKQPIKKVEMELALLTKGDRILLVKRPSEGLLANLWALPAVAKAALDPGKTLELELKENYGIESIKKRYIFEKKHIFTHMQWRMKLYAVELVSFSEIEYPEVQWVLLEELDDYPIGTAFKKVLKAIEPKDLIV